VSGRDSDSCWGHAHKGADPDTCPHPPSPKFLVAHSDVVDMLARHCAVCGRVREIRVLPPDVRAGDYRRER